MELTAAKVEIEKLRKLIAHHEYLYRQKNAPEIGDDEFDVLKRRLDTLEAQYPQFAAEDSPSKRVGSDLSSGFEEKKHLSPMLSLDNVFDKNELADFDQKLKNALALPAEAELEYCVEPKIDGAGISAVYENGKLARLLTRGDGEKGDDITKNLFLIKNIPTHLALSPRFGMPALLEVRGEAYMELDEFRRISSLQRLALTAKAKERKAREIRKTQMSLFDAPNAKAASTLSEAELLEIERKLPANPRNLAAGTMKLEQKAFNKNPELKKRSLKAVFYSIGTLEGAKIAEQTELPEALGEWGLTPVNWIRKARGVEDAFAQICKLEEDRQFFPFNTDGAVLKLNDISLHDAAGWTSRAPRWAIAWKYRAQRAQTKLLSITLQVGRTGVVTPVAELAPVSLSGSTVSRATLHNAGFIAQLDIREGDTVEIEKAGEIIPAVLRVIEEKRPQNSVPFRFPENCPACGSKLVKFGEKLLWRCPNLACPPQIRGRIEHFAARDAMDIKGLGKAVVDKLVSNAAVSTPADLYTLDKKTIVDRCGFGQKSADNLIEALNDSKRRELWRLICGLGILEIGEQFAKSLAKKFGTIDALSTAALDEIRSIEGLGSRDRKKAEDTDGAVRAMSVRAFFDNPHNLQIVAHLKDCGVNAVSARSSNQPKPFDGKTFAITGKLQTMSRQQAKAFIEDLGGKVLSQVSKETSYLLTNEKSGSEKFRKAAELGIAIIDESTLYKLAGTKMPAPLRQTDTPAQTELF